MLQSWMKLRGGTVWLFQDILVQEQVPDSFHVRPWHVQVRIQRGGTGGPDPPGKSQVIWVSIGNKQLDPSGKCWTPSGTLKNDSFL